MTLGPFPAAAEEAPIFLATGAVPCWTVTLAMILNAFAAPTAWRRDELDGSTACVLPLGARRGTLPGVAPVCLIFAGGLGLGSAAGAAIGLMVGFLP